MSTRARGGGAETNVHGGRDCSVERVAGRKRAERKEKNYKKYTVSKLDVLRGAFYLGRTTRERAERQGKGCFATREALASAASASENSTANCVCARPRRQHRGLYCFRRSILYQRMIYIYMCSFEPAEHRSVFCNGFINICLLYE